MAPNYIQLANDFLELGKENYRKEDYKEALRAFEHALNINNSALLSLDTDTSLLYNTALAAYNSKDWYKAGLYLSQLNDLSYSANVSHLLFVSLMEQSDTLAAVNALSDGVIRYNYNEKLVLLLSDYLYQNNEIPHAMSLLDSAQNRHPENPVLPYTKGLINQKTGNYVQAIEDYENSILLDPDKIEAYSHIANCYYNMAVDIDEKARNISSKNRYQAEKARAVTARESAIEWLEKAYGKDPLDEQVRDQLNKLNQFLMIDK